MTEIDRASLNRLVDIQVMRWMQNVKKDVEKIINEETMLVIEDNSLIFRTNDKILFKIDNKGTIHTNSILLNDNDLQLIIDQMQTDIKLLNQSDGFRGMIKLKTDLNYIQNKQTNDFVWVEEDNNEYYWTGTQWSISYEKVPNYVNVDEINERLDEVENKIPDIRDLATKNELDNEISSVKEFISKEYMPRKRIETHLIVDVDHYIEDGIYSFEGTATYINIPQEASGIGIEVILTVMRDNTYITQKLDVSTTRKSYTRRNFNNFWYEWFEINKINTLTTDRKEIITSEKTFNILPISSVSPTQDNHFINLSYLRNNYVPISGSTTIIGQKTFSAVPICNILASQNNHITTKQYVDSKLSVNVMTLDTPQTILSSGEKTWKNRNNYDNTTVFNDFVYFNEDIDFAGYVNFKSTSRIYNSSGYRFVLPAGRSADVGTLTTDNQPGGTMIGKTLQYPKFIANTLTTQNGYNVKIPEGSSGTLIVNDQAQTFTKQITFNITPSCPMLPNYPNDLINLQFFNNNNVFNSGNGWFNPSYFSSGTFYHRKIGKIIFGCFRLVWIARTGTFSNVNLFDSTYEANGNNLTCVSLMSQAYGGNQHFYANCTESSGYFTVSQNHGSSGQTAGELLKVLMIRITP